MAALFLADLFLLGHVYHKEWRSLLNLAIYVQWKTDKL